MKNTKKTLLNMLLVGAFSFGFLSSNAQTDFINQDSLTSDYSIKKDSLKYENLPNLKKYFSDYSMGNAYPNPATSNLTVPYSTPKDEKVSLIILSKIGEKPKVVTQRSQGKSKFNINVSEYSSGFYFYSIATESGYKKSGIFVKE